MKFQLKIWRQQSPLTQGRFETYSLDHISPDISFLEMLDQLNSQLEARGESPIVFESDCREGICGSCGMYINGQPHGPIRATTTCQLQMRHFQDGDTITVEPWRAGPFPIIRDLMVDRSNFDAIIQAGGYISTNTGSAPEANSLPIAKQVADAAFDAAACIGCGACVATCKNASAMLFVSAKVAHLSKLPQGQPERFDRARQMVAAHDVAGFGNCSNEGECEAACPKEIKMTHISQLNRNFLLGKLLNIFGD